MLLFLCFTTALFNKKNCKITGFNKILRPFGTNKYVTLGSTNSVDDLILKTGYPDKNETFRFRKKPLCRGYWLFANEKPFCYDMKQSKPVDCKSDIFNFMMWDVVNYMDGFLICTSAKKNIVFGKYFYEYCLTYDLESGRLGIERPKEKYKNQMFEIFEINGDKIPVLIENIPLEQEDIKIK